VRTVCLIGVLTAAAIAAARAGEPLWMHELQRGDEDAPRTVLLAWGRRCKTPLQVDLATLKVSLYGAMKSLGWTCSDESLHSRDGRLYEFSGHGCVLPLDDRLYATQGGIWYHIDLATGRVAQQGRLPMKPYVREFGVFSHYGLVGWHHDGTVCRLIVKEEQATPAAPGPDAEPPQKGSP